MPGGKERSLGATAMLGPRGYPLITSRTGGELAIATGADEPGFNPVDLLLASLASCLAMSGRIAVREYGYASRLVDIQVDVTAEKDPADSTRIKMTHAVLTISGDLPDSILPNIAMRAEEICTVSNALAVQPRIKVRKRPSPAI